jgi:hypothetical protein
MLRRLSDVRAAHGAGARRESIALLAGPRRQAETGRVFGMAAMTVSPAEFFAVDNVGGTLAGADAGPR